MPEQVTAHLDRGYDSATTRILLDEFGFTGEIARKGVPAPVQAGKRWVVERAHAWMNGYGKLRRCTERNARIVDFYLYLAAAFVVVRRLIQQARTRYRWDTRPPPNASSDTYCRALLRHGPAAFADGLCCADDGSCRLSVW
jgi:hypothetical protein